jgi:hypothetical protein
MIASPSPVQETATVSSSAHRPGRPAQVARGEHLALGLRDEPGRVAQLDAVVGGERARGGADEQDVVAVAQDRAGGADRVADALHARHGADVARRALHHRGVELDAAVARQRGAPPGVEHRVVLEHHDGGLDRVQRGAAAGEHGVARLDRGGRARAHPGDPVGVRGDAPGAPVHDDRWVGHLAPDDSAPRSTLVVWCGERVRDWGWC